MNPLLRCALTCLAGLAVNIAFGAGAPASTPTAAAPSSSTVFIVNFTTELPGVYGYGTWKDAFGIVPNTGFRVLGSKGAQANGGFCQTLSPALDLSKCSYIEIALSVQQGNEVGAYTIVLADDDGTQCSVRVNVAQLMPGQPVWLRVKPAEFAPSTRDPGKDGKLDWTKISQWHLQGDWSGPKPAQILFIALRGRV